MTEDQKATAEFMSRLDALIAAAPDDDEMPAESPQMPATPVLPPPRVNTPLIDFPDRHKRDLTLYGDEWRAAYEKALGIAESGGIIVAYGNRGTGKTQIAYEIAANARFPDPMFPAKREGKWSATYEERPAIYKKAMRIFLELKAGFNRPEKPSECEVIDSLVNAAFLVIDEAHVRGESKYEDDKLTHIIDERYDAMRPTMLVTNLTNKDFAAQLSPSIISRIQEIGGGIECNWQSYRKQTK